MNDESRPEAAHEIPATVSTSILPERRQFVTDAAAAADAWFGSSFAILVSGETVHRHVFRSLAAAERTVKAAHARGDYARMEIVRVVYGMGRAE